jgi:hypothetical protein
VNDKLSALELEVEQARTKLANDLAHLRSPQSYRNFGAGLKSNAQSVVQRFLNDLKARAAANPSATLAIGAGVAWKLMKNPPIATALIGAGMLSLWRAKPVSVDDQDYLETAQQRFGEQVSEAADAVREYAAESVVAAREKVGAYAQSAGDTIERFATSATKEAVGSMERAGAAAKQIPDKAIDAAQRASSQFSRAVGDEGVRDQVLLGLAGLAVAALGVAYQHRATDKMRPLD